MRVNETNYSAATRALGMLQKRASQFVENVCYPDDPGCYSIGGVQLHENLAKNEFLQLRWLVDYAASVMGVSLDKESHG